MIRTGFGIQVAKIVTYVLSSAMLVAKRDMLSVCLALTDKDDADDCQKLTRRSAAASFMLPREYSARMSTNTLTVAYTNIVEL